MNIEATKDLRGADLLRAVKNSFTTEPKRLAMGAWMYLPHIVAHYVPPESRPACNTVACIAGWCVLLVRGVEEALDMFVAEQAADLIGLPEEICDNLFFVGQWPDKLCDEYALDATNAEQRAAVAAKAIDWFIGEYLTPVPA